MTDANPKGFFNHAWRARHLFSVVPLFAIGTGALYPLIALELSASGYNNTLIGAMTSVWYLGAFLGTLFGGHIISQFGYHKTFVLTAVLAALSVWALNLSNLPAWWLSLRLLGGFGLGVYYLLMESWVSGLATSTTRGRMLATYEALRIGAVALGPVVLIIASTHTAFVLVGVLFVITVFPVALASSPASDLTPPNWRDALDVFVCSPCSLTLTVVAGLLSSSFYGFGAIYVKELGFSSAEIALFVSFIFVAPALNQLPHWNAC